MEDKKNKKETILVNGIEKNIESGILISEILQKIPMPCAGHGRCGKCKVQVEGVVSQPTKHEWKYLTQQEIDAGIRLACQTNILGTCKIVSIEEGKSEVVLNFQKDSLNTKNNSQAQFHTLGAAVDIGTTTLAVSVFDKNGLVGQAGDINPQVAFGADVISRIENSLNGKGLQLANSVQRGINELLKQACNNCEYSVENIDTLVITGNTVMLYLLTNRNSEPLSKAPFIADWLAGEWISAKELNLICSNAKVYLPRCISAFVGADIMMALLNTYICRDDKKRLLVDIGTNGEVVLWTGEKLLCCSTAAGPAFEGTGLSMGMTAKTGAISKVFLQDETFAVEVIGNQKPKGICGSGVIDAISCLLQSELIDETGYLEDEEVVISGTVQITQEDIRKIQLAKSAICAGIEALLHKADICVDDLEELLVAGGFGSKIDLKNAMKIGLLPKMNVNKIKVCGNAALAGAEMLLRQSTLLNEESKLIEKCQNVNLATDVYFQERYIEGMLFL